MGYRVGRAYVGISVREHSRLVNIISFVLSFLLAFLLYDYYKTGGFVECILMCFVLGVVLSFFTSRNRDQKRVKRSLLRGALLGIVSAITLWLILFMSHIFHDEIYFTEFMFNLTVWGVAVSLISIGVKFIQQKKSEIDWFYCFLPVAFVLLFGIFSYYFRFEEELTIKEMFGSFELLPVSLREHFPIVDKGLWNFILPHITLCVAWVTFWAFWAQLQANKRASLAEQKTHLQTTFYKMLDVHRENLQNFSFLHCHSVKRINGLEAIPYVIRQIGEIQKCFDKLFKIESKDSSVEPNNMTFLLAYDAVFRSYQLGLYDDMDIEQLSKDARNANIKRDPDDRFYTNSLMVPISLFRSDVYEHDICRYYMDVKKHLCSLSKRFNSLRTLCRLRDGYKSSLSKHSIAFKESCNREVVPYRKHKKCIYHLCDTISEIRFLVWQIKNKCEFSMYFMYLFKIIRFIDSSDILDAKEKEKYVDMLRTQLSPNEQMLIFLNWYAGALFYMTNDDNADYPKNYGYAWERLSKYEKDITYEKYIYHFFSKYKILSHMSYHGNCQDIVKNIKTRHDKTNPIWKKIDSLKVFK
ncbi:hypothetical protein K5X82_07795 [Halosquirtibacter xylanolyticus]|uniref:putative phage abortive infection protein n=1 Tax=Halosquirtibacter xylanolyticus TaxID=3374599 RepID=UPI00374919C2|nr:hypothetical protein K5X82_07795 [Prolixibacteraceae bacterium]